MEMKDSKPVSLEQSNKLKSLLGLDYDPHIFYNSVNIILTDHLEYEKLKSLVKRFEDVLKVEMIQFNLYLYIGHYINCPELKSILGE